MKKLVRFRDRAFREQSGRCFYCNAPMWLRDPVAYVREYSLPAKCLRLLQCTAEHLRPVSEGGGDIESNIVAACAFCNSTRHKARRAKPPARFAQRVRRRMAGGQWHTQAVLRALGQAADAGQTAAVLPGTRIEVRLTGTPADFWPNDEKIEGPRFAG